MQITDVLLTSSPAELQSFLKTHLEPGAFTGSPINCLYLQGALSSDLKESSRDHLPAEPSESVPALPYVEL